MTTITSARVKHLVISIASRAHHPVILMLTSNRVVPHTDLTAIHNLLVEVTKPKARLIRLIYRMTIVHAVTKVRRLWRRYIKLTTKLYAMMLDHKPLTFNMAVTSTSPGKCPVQSNNRTSTALARRLITLQPVSVMTPYRIPTPCRQHNHHQEAVINTVQRLLCTQHPIRITQ